MRGQPSMVCAHGGTVGSKMAVRLRLVAPLTLLSQAVSAALRSRGLEVVESAGGRVGRRPGRDASDEPGVLLLLEDLATAEDVRRALNLIASGRWRVLVLTAWEPGRHWGALLAAGAAAVMSSSSSLDDVEAALVSLDAGEDVGDPEQQRQLVADWEGFLDDEREVARRIAKLSAREQTVLAAMRGGASVPKIAVELEVAETTVRSQVKSILRKLGVRSQIAAVALVHRHESPLVEGALAANTRGRRRPRAAAD